MIEVVGVRFKNAGKIYYFSPGGLKLQASDNVIVETARGVEFGELVIPPRQVADEEVVLVNVFDGRARVARLPAARLPRCRHGQARQQGAPDQSQDAFAHGSASCE